MRNVTVKEFIEKLQSMNQDAIVCRCIDENEYSTIETVFEIKKAKYIDDSGNDAEGDIVSIY